MSEKFSLYSITNELKQLDEMFAESKGELTDEIEVFMERIETQLTTKTDSIVGYVKSRENFLKAIDDEIKRLNDGKKQVKRSIEVFNKYVVSCMDKMEKIELNGKLHKIKIKKPSQIVEILNESKIPIEFITRTHTDKISKTEIKKILKFKESDDLEKDEIERLTNLREKTKLGAKLSIGKRVATFS